MPFGAPPPQTTPVATTTGEPYLPTRLVYRVFDAAKVARHFKSLPSFHFDAFQQRWVWEIHPSLRRTRLKRISSYWEVGKDGTVLASCFFPSPERMDVYLSCGFRAALFLEFFDGVVPRNIAVGEFIDQINVLPAGIHPDTKNIPKPKESFPANDEDIPFYDDGAVLDAAETEAELREASRILEERQRSATLRPLERHRLEMFYADGPDSYYHEAMIRDTLALVQHATPYPINPHQVLMEALAAPDPESFVSDLKAKVRK